MLNVQLGNPAIPAPPTRRFSYRANQKCYGFVVSLQFNVRSAVWLWLARVGKISVDRFCPSYPGDAGGRAGWR